ncbi:hypothetical protein Ethha_2491 [Ethanoligenens harbinense YUAN-3]|uniref:CopG family transcriptional regulator n=1 Tax=Ethanoligenens harbinense (strain DSM 18485 / JCM 12961 / CGMCC 1.5033 / YUAN-3) TaxID=663278 RepID=E6U5W7_ETHHY|nr:hypothetical protein Ethha_2491 [Ethanoligenens harbinense YUAN-3]
MPRTGRPTDDPKTLNTRIRFSEGDVQKLDYCCKVLGLTKAEVIRQGIEEMYQKAQKQK